MDLNIAKNLNDLFLPNGKYNPDILFFLHHLFPSDLTVKAISILESSLMFIYLWKTDVSAAIEKFYADPMIHWDENFQFRLIVKEDDGPIYVDIQNWNCSCNDYCKQMLKVIHENDSTLSAIDHKKSDIKDILTYEIDDVDKFSNDSFAQLNGFSLSKQRYFRVEKCFCSHLLAFALVLFSRKQILQMCEKDSKVIMLNITDKDEWLRLHINIL